MAKRRTTSTRRVTKGSGLISGILSAGDKVLNKAIDLLPVELHLPSYNYCGPGTKLAKRLARGDKGVNPLDEACKAHDIAYSKYSDSEHRREADKILTERAWSRVKSDNASLGERAAAWAVTTAMKAKTKLGGGRRRGGKKLKRPKGKEMIGLGLYLKPYHKGSGLKTYPNGGGLYLKPYTKGRGLKPKSRNLETSLKRTKKISKKKKKV